METRTTHALPVVETRRAHQTAVRPDPVASLVLLALDSRPNMSGRTSRLGDNRSRHGLTVGTLTTWLRPAALARYMAASTRRRTSSRVSPRATSATPALTV